MTEFLNVNGRDRVLNPGPLSQRPDKSSTTPRSATSSMLSLKGNRGTKLLILMYTRPRLLFKHNIELGQISR
jgi:hypothetical protein